MDELYALIDEMLAAGESDENILAAVSANKNKTNYVTAPEVSQPQPITNEFPTVSLGGKDIRTPLEKDKSVIVPGSAYDIEMRKRSDTKDQRNETIANVISDAIYDIAKFRDVESIISDYPTEALASGFIDKFNPATFFTEQIKLKGYKNFHGDVVALAKTRFNFEELGGNWENVLDHFVTNGINRNILDANENEIAELSKKALMQMKDGTFFDGIRATEKYLIKNMQDPVRRNLAEIIHKRYQNRIQYNQLKYSNNPDIDKLNALDKAFDDLTVPFNIAHEEYKDKYTHDKMLINPETGMRYTPMEGPPPSNVRDKTSWHQMFWEEIDTYRKSGDLSKIRAKFGLFSIQHSEHLLELQKTVKIGEINKTLTAQTLNHRKILEDLKLGEDITLKDLLHKTRQLSRQGMEVYFDVNENNELVLSDKSTDFHESLFVLDDHDIDIQTERIGWEEVYLLNRDMGAESKHWGEEIKEKLSLAGENFIESFTGNIWQSQHEIDQIVLSTAAGGELSTASRANLAETLAESGFKTVGQVPFMAMEFAAYNTIIGRTLGAIGKGAKMMKLTKVNNLLTPIWLNQQKLFKYVRPGKTAKDKTTAINVTSKGVPLIKDGLPIRYAPGTKGAKYWKQWKKKGLLPTYKKQFNHFNWAGAHAIRAGQTELVFNWAGMDLGSGLGFHIAGLGWNGLVGRIGLKFNPKHFGKDATKAINRAGKLDYFAGIAANTFAGRNLLGKLMTSGGIMVPGVFMGTMLNGAYQDIIDNKDFQTIYDDNYGEWSDKSSPHYVPRKLLQEVITGIAFGFTHVTKADFVHFLNLSKYARGKLADRRASIMGVDKINLEIKKVLSKEELKEIEKLDSFIMELDMKIEDMKGTAKYIDPNIMKEHLQGKEVNKAPDGNPISYIYQLNNRNMPKGSNANIEFIKGTGYVVRYNLNKVNDGTVPHELFHLWTSDIPPAAFDALFNSIVPLLRPSAKGFGEAVAKEYKDQDPTTIPSEKVTNLIEQLMLDPSRLINLKRDNVFKTIQEKLYKFVGVNLTKGIDPLGQKYDPKPDIGTAGKTMKFLLELAKGLDAYKKGDPIPKEINQLKDLVIDGEKLIDIKSNTIAGQRRDVPKMSQRELDMFDTDIKGPSMKTIFFNINESVSPEEWKALDKTGRQNAAFNVGFEMLNYIRSKIKLKGDGGKEVSMERKTDIAMELIAPGGEINKWLTEGKTKWDPDIVPELTRYIFQQNSRLLNYKIVDALKKQPEYGNITVGLDKAKELTTKEVTPKDDIPIAKYRIKVLETLKNKYGEYFDPKNNIEKGLNKVMTKVTAENLSYKEVAELSKDPVIKEIYDYLQINAETKPAEFNALSKAFVYSNKRELWESLPNAYDMKKGISQGVKNNFPPHWYPLTGGRFKFKDAPMDMTRAEKASGPQVAIKLKEIPPDFLDWFYGKNIRGNVAKTRLQNLFEHAGRGIGNQTMALRMEKDPVYRDNLRKDNPDLLKEYTFDRIIQELRAAKSPGLAQRNADKIFSHLTDKKYNTMTERYMAINNDPTIPQKIKDIALRYLVGETKPFELTKDKKLESIKGMKDIIVALKLLKGLSYGEIAKNYENPKVQKKFKNTLLFQTLNLLKGYNVNLKDLPSNVQSYIRTSMGPDIKYIIDAKGNIKQMRSPTDWTENTDDVKKFTEKSGKEILEKFNYLQWVYRPGFSKLKPEGEAYTLKLNKEWNKGKLSDQEYSIKIADWHLERLIGPKNLKRGLKEGLQPWEIYEKVKESNQKFALDWITSLNKVVQNWKKNGFKNKKEAQTYALASIGMHTNIRDGVYKSFVYSFRSVTNNPKQQPRTNKDAKPDDPFTYFEHERQLGNTTNLLITNMVNNGSKSGVFKKETKKIIETSYQSITSVFNQKITDSAPEGGRMGFNVLYAPYGKVKTSTSSLLNIIRDFKDLGEQVRIGTKDNGRTELEIMAEKVDPKELFNTLKKAKDLTIQQYYLRDKLDSEINVKPINKKLATTIGLYSQRNISNEDLIRNITNKAEAIRKSRDVNAPKKGASFLDFDNTVGETKSMIKYEIPRHLPDGRFNPAVVGWGKIEAKGKLTPEEFAKRSEQLEKYGAKFDFSEFTKVIKGKKGPLFEKLVKIQEKYGTENTFILTARPQEAAGPIQKFLKGLGVHIPKENIIGLEDGRPGAKANFIVEKAAEGYNEIYFVDDAIQNVKAVKDIIKVLGIDGKVREVKQQAQRDLSTDFNKVLEESRGIEEFKVFSRGAAKTRGADIGKWKWWLPPSAEGFLDLMYPTFGRGKKGDKHMKWYDENLGKPYAHGFYELNKAKQRIHDDYQALKKKYPNIKNKINKDSGYNKFTNDAAVRVYLWNKNGMEIPELSKTDIKALVKIVKSNPELQAYAEQVSRITQLKEGYIKPTESWLARSIQHDLLEVSNNVGRQQFFKEWIDNKNAIFTDANLNKLEATLGSRYRNALEDMLYRMEHGINKHRRSASSESFFNTWIANATGTVMFLNRRSALTQTISMINFVNWKDNNPLKVGKAFANQPQFWKDFTMIWNSPMLKQRRKGLTMDVNYEEMVNTIQGKKDKVSAAVAYMLNKGFVFTRLADNWAIAFGGAPFYRNRLNSYLKQGLKETEAKEKAFIDFQEASEPTQQSSRPDLISQQQASPLGRFLLTFQNVTMQNNRNGKRAFLDLINNRGDHKTNISKIVYYFGVQNMIFLGMQQALFAAYWDEDADENDITKKHLKIGNGLLDSILRGSGMGGVVVSTLKNTILKYMEESKKGWKGNEAKVLIEGLKLSPPVGSKAQKIYSAMLDRKFNKDSILKPSLLATEGLTNIPFHEFYEMVESGMYMSSEDLEDWQKIAIALGYPEWQINYDPKEPEKIVTLHKKKKKKLKKKKY